jgi:hypothetical protein
MFVHQLPQLCVHLIADFVEDDLIVKHEEMLMAEYKINREIEMLSEIVDYDENNKLTKKELFVLTLGKKYGYNPDHTTAKKLKEDLRLTLSQLIRNKSRVLQRCYSAFVGWDLWDDIHFRNAYKRYSAYEQFKAKRDKKALKALKNK